MVSSGRSSARELTAAAVQYGLLFGFAAVAAAISAQGLTGFARVSMGLRGPWPYLLWGALDGAAGLCAVLLMRRAARREPALALRLAVWGLVAASSGFNWAHAPHHPAAREAFALMPVIAAVLFEFSLRETRHASAPASAGPVTVPWLHPAERIRIRLQLAADDSLPAATAIRRVRRQHAARRLYLLRRAMGTDASRQQSHSRSQAHCPRCPAAAGPAHSGQSRGATPVTGLRHRQRAPALAVRGQRAGRARSEHGDRQPSSARTAAR